MQRDVYKSNREFYLVQTEITYSAILARLQQFFVPGTELISAEEFEKRRIKHNLRALGCGYHNYDQKGRASMYEKDLGKGKKLFTLDINLWIFFVGTKILWYNINNGFNYFIHSFRSCIPSLKFYPGPLF